MKITLTLLLLGLASLSASAQQPDSSVKLAELERKLDQAARQIDQLNGAVLALRAEIARIKGSKTKMAGNTPSTLLGIEPEFAPAFRPGAKSAGGALFATWRLTNKDH